ncbi:glycoside hydrolase family 71 protein [Coraliomargarita algicola]|uniref:Glycoside hydrolase family 71 protein n=1 Tax=Coraliomargarita algicola TaxID=3092156 RepID=A0ABZ0RLM1_9BACT|nr:glycoside hydrolase family 71 protein [Coraliomargarita sp. J2-16]WPJ96129.1 glycoside hydrolase family 71 protein [Coraliomargarita sp. J2-16]
MIQRLISCLCLVALANGTYAQTTLQWPFDQDSPVLLRQSPKKVFIHYFSPFPVSIDNKDGWGDYYEIGYLDPHGENDKHISYGGYLRQRPLPRKARSESDWYTQDMVDEVELAAALGVDGFTYNMLSVKDSSNVHWLRLLRIIDAAESVDNGFKIMLMPDMSAGYKSVGADVLADSIKAAVDHDYNSDFKHEVLYRLADGRLVISPYSAHLRPVSFWEDFADEMDALNLDFVLWPLFQGWTGYIEDFAQSDANVVGFSDWGVSAYAWQAGRKISLNNNSHHGLEFMAPVRPQDFRPKNKMGYEGLNSALFREQWDTALNEPDASMVQIISWNDYSEATEITPSTHTRYAFYDLAAYYVSWFKNEQQPAIIRDALYYFYRVQPHDAEPSSAYQDGPFVFSAQDTPQSEIELLAFLTSPGTIEITINGQTTSSAVGSGIQSLTVPLQAGVPSFRLIRNGSTVMEMKGNWEITDNIEFSNLLVHADGGTLEAPRVMPALGEHTINFIGQSYTAYSHNQDSSGTSTLINNTTGWRLTGNRWRKLGLHWPVTENTLLEFDLSITNQGELIGIGLDNDNDYITTGISPETPRIFKVAGAHGVPSEWNDFSTTYYAHAGGSDYMCIPVGEYFTGDMVNLAFIADDDSAASADVCLSNLRILEGKLVDFDDYIISSYGGVQDGQQGMPSSAVSSDGGLKLELSGNAWKCIPLDYKVSKYTVLEFELFCHDAGEILGIGLDNDTDFQDEKRFFQLAGSDVLLPYGWQESNGQYAGTTTFYSIAVGDFYTGTMTKLFLVADDDDNGSAAVIFKNIKLYEDYVR